MNAEQPLLREFLHHLQHSKRYSTHTLKAYERDLVRFLDHIAMPCADASVKQVQSFVNYLHRKGLHG